MSDCCPDEYEYDQLQPVLTKSRQNITNKGCILLISEITKKYKTRKLRNVIQDDCEVDTKPQDDELGGR